MRTEDSLKDYRPSRLVLPNIQPLHEDEPAWSLYERDVLSYNGKQFRREQTIRVARAGRLVEFTCDLGPAADWTIGNFVVMSLFEDSVGQVREAAEFMREEADKGLERAMQEHLEDVNVIEAAVLRAEQMQTWQRRNTHTTTNLRHQLNPKKDRPLLFAVTAPQHIT